jgi:hypothetical protein
MCGRTLPGGILCRPVRALVVFDVRGEGVEHLAAAGDSGVVSVQGREEPVVPGG